MSRTLLLTTIDQALRHLNDVLVENYPQDEVQGAANMTVTDDDHVMDDDLAWQDFAPPLSIIYLPKVSALLSILGSAIILAEIRHDLAYHRACCSWLGSSGYVKMGGCLVQTAIWPATCGKRSLPS